MKHILEKYRKRLSLIPAPGGNGCHPALLGAANLGVMAGLSADQIFRDIRENIPHGGRQVLAAAKRIPKMAIVVQLS